LPAELLPMISDGIRPSDFNGHPRIAGIPINVQAAFAAEEWTAA
jgi:hypothetical protein